MLDFIINPTAGGKGGKRISRALEKIKKRLAELKVDYTLHFTDHPRHATTLTAQLIERGATDIIVAGGDGTLHEVINGFSDFERVSLGIIPCGTGNDFADALGIPKDPVKALEDVIFGKPAYTDFMQMPTVRGLNVIGMGVDVEVLKRYAACKKKTRFTYTTCLIKTLLHKKMTEFDAEFNGSKQSYSSFIACIANGKQYGGGIPICPVAKPFDGALDFVAVENVSGLKMISAFLKLKRGKLLTLPQTFHDKCQSVKIIPQGDYTVNVDGELYENIPFEVNIVSNALRVYKRLPDCNK